MESLEINNKCFLGGGTLKDNQTMKEIGFGDGGRIFFKDLGIQIGWSTVNLN